MSISSPVALRPRTKILELALYGRGGQAAKTCGDVLTLALYLAGYKPHGQPRYSADRMGAPVFYGIRFRQDNAPIFDRSWIRDPDFAVVFDDSLLNVLRLPPAWRPGITVVLNLPQGEPLPAELAPFRVFRLDGNRIAHRCGLMKGNTPILSSVMAGAVARVAEWFDLREVEEALRQMGKAAMGNLREANLEALRQGYEAVQAA